MHKTTVRKKKVRKKKLKAERKKKLKAKRKKRKKLTNLSNSLSLKIQKPLHNSGFFYLYAFCSPHIHPQFLQAKLHLAKFGKLHRTHTTFLFKQARKVRVVIISQLLCYFCNRIACIN